MLLCLRLKRILLKKLKKQNPQIKECIDKGSEFSIVYIKKPQTNNSTGEIKSFYQVVVRVSDDIRKVIRANDDKIFMDLVAHRVNDRFYVKRCNKCQKFGHYEKDCKSETCCGYCRSNNHSSNDCNEVQEADHEHYECINCQRAGRDYKGHSSRWNRCPMYLERQQKMKKMIPYYDQKNFI